jgi:predicted metal-dependent hydrolase
VAGDKETTMALKKKKKWIQKATSKMKRKGTLGKFGKATAKKIGAAKKKGGLSEKRAVFAENMKHIAEKRKRAAKRA